MLVPYFSINVTINSNSRGESSINCRRRTTAAPCVQDDVADRDALAGARRQTAIQLAAAQGRADARDEFRGN